MNVKSYIGNNNADVMNKIRRELGPDAVILHTRKIRKKGFAGFFGKKIIEIVVAVDEKTKYANAPIKKKLEDNPKMHEALEAIRNLSHDLSESEKRDKAKDIQNDEEMKKMQTNVLVDEVGNLKSMVSDLVNEMKSLKKEINVEIKSVDDKLDGYKQDDEIFSETDFETQIRVNLQNKGVTAQTVDCILNRFINHGKELESNEQVYNAIINMLEPVENIKIGPQNQVLLFVGPTGVGKTTTLAKLAAKLSLVDGCSVGLITADTYRIAAVDQLRTYSEILGIPFTVVYDASEVKGVLEAYKDKDFILVDTAGRSHKRTELKDDLSNLLRNFENADVFLVMSLTTGYNDMVSIVDSYSFIKDYKLIFTKLDESDAFANILNIKSVCSAPMSYFTTGQNVPDDIEVANPDKIINFILEE